MFLKSIFLLCTTALTAIAAEDKEENVIDLEWVRIWPKDEATERAYSVRLDCDLLSTPLFARPKRAGAECTADVDAGAGLGVLCLGTSRNAEGVPHCREAYVEPSREGLFAGPRLAGQDFDFNLYHTYEEYQEAIDLMGERDGCAVIPSVATTYEGRTVRGIQIGDGDRVLVITSGLHAREWASLASMFHTLNALTRMPFLVPAGLRVVVFPMSNPDGFEFSRTTYRMNRCNRMTANAVAAGCSRFNVGNGAYAHMGIDLNRNWDGTMPSSGPWGTAGISHSPCDGSVYCGEAAFDQAESSGIRDYVLGLKAQGLDIYAGIDQHTYGAMILHSPGHCYDGGWQSPQCPSGMIDFSDGIELSRQMAVAATGAGMMMGQQTEYDWYAGVDLYPTSGTTIDWFVDVTSTGIGLCAEMTDTGVGGYGGFEYPEESIPVVGAETKAWLLKAIQFCSVNLPPVPSPRPTIAGPAPTGEPTVTRAPSFAPTPAPTHGDLPECDDDAPRKWVKKGKDCASKRKYMLKRQSKVCGSNGKWVKKQTCQQTCFDLGEPWAYGECASGIFTFDADGPPDCQDTPPDEWLAKGDSCSSENGKKKAFKVNAKDEPKNCAGNPLWIENRYCEKTCWHGDGHRDEPFRYNKPNGKSDCGDSTWAPDST